MFRLHKVCIIVVVLVAYTPARASGIVLTGLSASVADSSGNAGGHVWNTLPGDGIHNLWITGPDLLGDFINGPLDTQVPVLIPLPAGNHEFTLVVDQHSVDIENLSAFYVLNLFFDNAHELPAISVVAPYDVSGSGADPDFLPFAGTTYNLTWTGVPCVDSLEFMQGDLLIQLTAYRWSHPDVEGLNRVSTFEAFPNGDHVDDGNDFVAQFTVLVTTVPEITARSSNIRPWASV